MVNRFVDIEEKLEQANREIDQIWEQFYREVEKRRDPLEQVPMQKMVWQALTIPETAPTLPPEFASEIPAAKVYYQFLVPLRIRTAEKIWSVRKQVFAETYTFVNTLWHGIPYGSHPLDCINSQQRLGQARDYSDRKISSRKPDSTAKRY